MIRVRAFVPADIPAALLPWQRTDGIGLNESDTPEALARFLACDPGLGAVAERDGWLRPEWSPLQKRVSLRGEEERS